MATEPGSAEDGRPERTWEPAPTHVRAGSLGSFGSASGSPEDSPAERSVRAEFPLLGPAEIADAAMAWPVVGHTVLGAGTVSAFVDDRVRTPTGDTMTRQYLLHPGAVGVIAWDEADRIAVVRQYRHPVGYRLTEPPAGLLDHDHEDFLVAVRRELAEEAGLQAGRWNVLVDLFTTPGANQETLRIYLARSLSAAAAPAGFVADHEEAEMDVCWAQRADLVDAVLAGRLQNPTMVAGVLALETARLGGRLESLRPADAPWPAREVRLARNSELAALGGGAELAAFDGGAEPSRFDGVTRGDGHQA